MKYRIKKGKLFINNIALNIYNLKFEREIGKGANAHVFLAKNILLDRYEAVKVWFPRKGYSAVDPERFKKEAQKNASFDNLTNIAKFYDAGCIHGLYFARMQYIDGISLSDFLLGVPEFLYRYIILKKILNTVQAVYDMGLYHGDLHSGNILIADNEPYIIDFGTSIFSGKIDSQERDCEYLIKTSLNVVPEIKDFDFFDEEECLKQGSIICAKLLLRLLQLVWYVKTMDFKKIDNYTYNEFCLKLYSTEEEFNFINKHKTDAYIFKLFPDKTPIKRITEYIK